MGFTISFLWYCFCDLNAILCATKTNAFSYELQLENYRFTWSILPKNKHCEVKLMNKAAKC